MTHIQFSCEHKLDNLRHDYKNVVMAIDLIDSLSNTVEPKEGIWYLGSLLRTIKYELMKIEEKLFNEIKS